MPHEMVRKYLGSIPTVRTMYHLSSCIYKRLPISLFLRCDVPISIIPRSTKFPHALGIVIGSDTKIGENCTIYQNVVIGIRHEGDLPAVIGNNVKIYTDAKIFGHVKIGDNAIIGACSMVFKDVDANQKVVGVWK